MNTNTLACTPISPVYFAERFSNYWTNTLGHTSSPQLEKAWMTLGATFGRQIWHHDNLNERKAWSVLPIPTGAGKTQGTGLYCAMMSYYDPKSGALLIVRRMEDADTLAETVNTLAKAGPDYAYSHHSGKTQKKPEQLAEHSVLVITHSAYRNAMAGISGASLDTYLKWTKGDRRLVVIDEAFDLTQQYLVTCEDLRKTLSFTPDYLRIKFARECEVLENAISLLEQASGDGSARAVLSRTDYGLMDGELIDFRPLREAIHSVTIGQMERYSEAAVKLAKTFDETLDNLQIIVQDWSLYAKVPKLGRTLQTSKLIVPKEIKGAVVLDATAQTNLTYDLFPLAKVDSSIPKVRHYSNVTLHVRRGATGKVAARSNADERLPVLMDYLNSTVADKEVFFVCHKDVKPKVLAQEAMFELKVGHWGELDGSNKWKDCDTAVFYDLHQRPHQWAMTTYFALQGVQSDDWIASSKLRKHGDYEDVVASMVSYQTITDLIQAMNRIRCRVVVDDQGHCPSADVFLSLPKGDRGDLMLKKLLTYMPGMKVTEWYLPTETKVRKKRSDGGQGKDLVYNFLRNAPSGNYLVQNLRDTLDIKETTMKRIVKAFKNDDDGLLSSINVSYLLEGFGRGSKAYFMKQ